MPAPGAHPRRIIVVGDSISAGIGNDIAVWPDLLERRYHIEVTNLSRPGLTIAGAIEQAEKLQSSDFTGSIVILEIGGNDILGGRDARSFNKELDELLDLLHGAPQLLLFELPLPPFYNRYAKSQRRLTKKYNAALIPKRVISKIIREPGATIDGLHLSQKGQQMMEELVRGMVFDETYLHGQ
jgi:acyl-CoA thioesterase-1